MGLPRTFVNRFDETWTVEHQDNAWLTHIGGFLMTCGDLSRVTLSTHLAEEDKARGLETLLDQLSNTPVGTAHVRLWHPDDT